MDPLEPRALARLVLHPDWTINESLNLQPEQIDAAIAEIENAQPLAKIEPEGRGPETKAILDALRPIGAKIMPTASQGQADAWRVGVMLALSDLPPRIALYAVRKTIHDCIRFPHEVDIFAREHATEALKRQALALHRLKRTKEEIERALNPPAPLLEAPPMEWTQATVDQANESFARLGIKTRYRLAGSEVESYQSEPDEREEERQKTAKFAAPQN